MADDPVPAEPAAKAPVGKRLSSWMKAHPHQAEAAGVGVALGGVALYKLRSSSSSSSNPSASASSSTPTPSPTPDYGGYYGPQGYIDPAQLDTIEGQLNNIGNDLQQKAPTTSSGSGGSSGSTPATVNGDGTSIVNIPSSTKHEAIVDAVAAPDGGVWYLAKDGGVFAEGGSKFYGSFPGLPAATRGNGRSFVTLIPTEGGGYSEIDTAGEAYHFGPSDAAIPAKAPAAPTAGATKASSGPTTTTVNSSTSKPSAPASAKKPAPPIKKPSTTSKKPS